MIYLPCRSHLYSTHLHNNNMLWSVAADISITKECKFIPQCYMHLQRITIITLQGKYLLSNFYILMYRIYSLIRRTIFSEKICLFDENLLKTRGASYNRVFSRNEIIFRCAKILFQISLIINAVGFSIYGFWRGAWVQNRTIQSNPHNSAAQSEKIKKITHNTEIFTWNFN